MDEKDKEFIKETVETSIDKKLSSFKKETENGRKLDKLQQQKQNKEDKQELLAELTKLNQKGEATMAQKMEILKLSIDNAIPDDFKDALQVTKKGLKSGAADIGSGVSHLTQRAMMSNPLTAMLYQNRDIFKAVGQIGVGGAKMLGGVIGGAGSAAGGMFNTAINKVKKAPQKKQKQQKRQDDTQVSIQIAENGQQIIEIEQEEQSSSKSLLGTKKSMADQIDEIHEYLLKIGQKEQKTSNAILAKGLSGLGKTMKSVQAGVDLVAGQSKLVLGALLVGSVALLGLVAWVKNGGISKLIQSALNINLNKEGVQNAEDAINTFNTTMNNPETFKERYDEAKNQDYGKITITDEADKVIDNKFHIVTGNSLNKAYGEELGHEAFVQSSKQLIPSDLKKNKSYTSETGRPLSFPVALRIIRITPTAHNGLIITIQNWDTHAKYFNTSLIISGVQKVLFPYNYTIPANTIFALLGKEGQIIGDLSKFTAKSNAENTNFSEYLNTDSDLNARWNSTLKVYNKDSKRIDSENLKTNALVGTRVGVTAKMQKIKANPLNMLDTTPEVENKTEKSVNIFTGKVTDNINNQPSNQDRINNQNKEINQLKQNDNPKTSQATNTSKSAGVPNISVDSTKSDKIGFANHMSSYEYYIGSYITAVG